MKTINFNMDLMIPNQDNKDVIYNESLLMIDSFMQITVNQFIENAPDDFTVGKKYIIINEEYKDYICYLSHESKSFQYFKPQTGMILFVIERNNFFIYNGENCLVHDKKINDRLIFAIKW